LAIAIGGNQNFAAAGLQVAQESSSACKLHGNWDIEPVKPSSPLQVKEEEWELFVNCEVEVMLK